MPTSSPPLALILGAGINGAACARELAVNGVSVVVVDAADVAYGASSKSTRLIHGGLRYLEYGEFALVKESLQERTRLLWQAPHLVRRLRLCIPVNNRTHGVLPSILRFLGLERWADALAQRKPGSTKTRGLWLVRMGLRMYEIYARDRTMPPHSVHRAGDEQLPAIDAKKYPWLAAYSDGQIVNTERWVVDLLEDARQAAAEAGSGFEVYTYHRAVPRDGEIDITPVEGAAEATARIRPDVIINACGAGGDATLRELGIESRTLFAGTKGSHVITHHPALKQAIRSKGVYAEAADGRLIFVLPFGNAVLIGTTDEPFPARPETAVATEEEISYLLKSVNELFPDVTLTRDDVALHYSGIRPLPKSSAEEQHLGELPVLTLIGGKLTTCRALGEQTVDRILELLGKPRVADTRDRYVPGGENYPADAAAVERELARLAEKFPLPPEQIAAVWEIYGSRTESTLAACEGLSEEHLDGTEIPLAVVRYMIEREWVARIEDVAERRLILIFDEELSRRTLSQIAELLVDCGKLSAADVDVAIAQAETRLERFYGRRLTMSQGDAAI